MKGMRIYDLVIWGASGFTGRCMVDYLTYDLWKRQNISSTLQKNNFRWAIAGRNSEKLQGVRKESLEYAKSQGITPSILPDILTGSLEDSISLDGITGKTKVLISAAGPYAQLGDPIVDSCIRMGCDYIDVTGETPWVRRIIDKHHITAKEKKLYVIPMCGFDSVPSDLGVWFTVQKMKQKWPNVPIRKIHSYVVMRGKFSGGTIASGLGMDKENSISNPFLLGGQLINSIRPEDKDFEGFEFDPTLQRWIAPSGMAHLNTRVVRRTNGLLHELGQSYGVEFNYQEKSFARDQNQAKAMAKGLPSPKIREQLVKSGALPKPGEGPDREQRKSHSFEMTFFGETTQGHKLSTVIKGKDMYEFTGMSAVEAALLLINHRDKCSNFFFLNFFFLLEIIFFKK